MLRIVLAAMVGVAVPAAAAQAQPVADFYKDKTIRMIVGSGAGGGSDVFTRILAKFFAEHMPGKPQVVVQNLPTAGGVVAAGQIYNSLPRDGTVIGSVMRTIPVLPLLSAEPQNFDPRKMSWIGNLNRETNVIVTWGTSQTRTIDDIFKRETVVGTSGPGSDTHVYTVLINKTLGAKFKPVTGYPGGPEIDLAMQRGEVEGRVSITWTSLKTTRADWITNKRVHVIAQMALERHPDLPAVPNILELVKDPLDRQVWRFLFARQETGRPFVAGPDVPADRLAALRKAFADAANDKRFIAEIESKGGTIEFTSGEELQAFVEKLYETPPEVLKAVRAALQ